MASTVRASIFKFAIAATMVFAFGQLSVGQGLLGSLKGPGGTSSRSERKRAIASIPFGELTDTAAQRIQSVVNKPTIYRRMPVKTIECDAELYTFLIRNPEVVVDIWKLMGVTQLSLDRRGPYTFRSADGAGTTSDIELLYGTQQKHVYYGHGVYEGPLFKKPIQGECVLVLNSEFRKVNGTPMVTSRLDMFLQIDQNAIEVFAKTFQPILGKAADVNFAETANFLQKLSDTARGNSQGMLHMSNRLTGVSPAVRSNFAKVASTVSQRNPRMERRAAAPRSVRPASAESPISHSRRRPRRISGYRDDGSYFR